MATSGGAATRVFNNLTQNIPNSALTNLSWAGSGTDYDNEGIFNSLVGFELTEQGIYLLEAMVQVTAPRAVSPPTAGGPVPGAKAGWRQSTSKLT